ncbi:hypothetical protein MAHJHV57_50180 [Mycobacterium avium subsp. hominissuis]
MAGTNRSRPLLAELAVEYAQRYGGTPSAHLSWLPVPRDELAPPVTGTPSTTPISSPPSGGASSSRGTGNQLRCALGVPVTGGAFRRYDAETAELKRIWTDAALALATGR